MGMREELLRKEKEFLELKKKQAEADIQLELERSKKEKDRSQKSQSSSTPTSSSSSNTSKQQTKPEQSKVRAYNMSSNMFNFIIIKYTTLINSSQLQCYSQPCFIILNLDNKMLHDVTPDNK